MKLLFFKLKNLIQSALSNAGFRRYFANTSWMFGEQILRMISGLLVGIWVARYLGPEQIGIFSYALAFVAIFNAFAKLGLDGIVVRDLVNEPHKRDVYLGTAFWLKLIAGLATFLIIAFATLFCSNDSTTNLYILIIAGGIIFQSFEVVDFYFQSKVLSKFVSISKITQLVISSLLKVYFVLTGADLLWFVVISFVDQFALAVILYFAYKKLKVGSFLRFFNISIAKKMLNDSWPLIVTGLSIVIYMRIDQIMLKEMIGMRQVGIYTAALRLSESWYFVPVLICTSLFPAIVNAKKSDNDLYMRRLNNLYFHLIWIAILVALIATFISNNIVNLLFGIKYIVAGEILSVHIWSGVFVVIGVLSGQWFLLEGCQKIATLNTIIGALINIVLNCLMIPIYGVKGVAYATLISYSFSSYFLLFFNRKTRVLFHQITNSIFWKK